jgi:hypothetical protein
MFSRQAYCREVLPYALVDMGVFKGEILSMPGDGFIYYISGKPGGTVDLRLLNLIDCCLDKDGLQPAVIGRPDGYYELKSVQPGSRD